MIDIVKLTSGLILVGDVLESVGKIRASTVHLVVTSPPYYKVRDYGYKEQWGQESTYKDYLRHIGSLCKELYRIVKDDGVVCFNIADTFEKRSLIGIPGLAHRVFIHSGFICINDMIWIKPNIMPAGNVSHRRPAVDYEHVLIMAKSNRYFYNYTVMRVPMLTRGLMPSIGKKHRSTGVRKHGDRPIQSQEFRAARSTFLMPTARSKTDHPAVMPYRMAEMFIKAFSQEKDVVLDPFAGSGTTLIAAKRNDRRFIGIEYNRDYVRMIKDGLEQEWIIE